MLHGRTPFRIPGHSILRSSFRSTSSFQNPLLCNSLILAFSFCFLIGLFFYGKQALSPPDPSREISLSLLRLIPYTFFSLCRGMFAYFFSLLFSIALGYLAAKDRFAEKILIPLIDILQSVPVLGFMPGLFLLAVFLFPHSNLGLELASIVMIFTAQTWNITLGFYGSLRTVPKEKIDCADIYGLGRIRKFFFVELPESAISLLWNSVTGVAGGWFFLMVSEAFTLGNHEYWVPGVGSYMKASVQAGYVPGIIGAVIAMIGLILLLDRCLWHPLILESNRFRSDDIAPSPSPRSSVISILKNSFLAKIRPIPVMLSLFPSRLPKLPFSLFSRSVCFFLLLAILLGGYSLFGELVLTSPAVRIESIKAVLATFSRVILCLLIGLFVALPSAIYIGLSEKRSARFAPFLQIFASFPATLLFPVIILGMYMLSIPIEIGTVFLLLTGSIWYILFTALAGMSAIPSEYKEAAELFRLGSGTKFRSLYIPAIFPYLITGMLAASGGAWNASIVAECISYRGEEHFLFGIGSLITRAATEGNIPALLVHLTVMGILIAGINYGFWLPLYRYSEKRFTLNV